MSHPPFPPSPLACTHNGLYPRISVTMLNLRIISLRGIHVSTWVDNMLPLLYKSRGTNGKRETVTFNIQYYDLGWGSLFWVRYYVSTCADICAFVYASCWNHSLIFLFLKPRRLLIQHCLFLRCRVRLAHHIYPVGWREVYLIFMAVRPLRAGVTTEEWSMLGRRLAKNINFYSQNKRETTTSFSKESLKQCFSVWNYILSSQHTVKT